MLKFLRSLLPSVVVGAIVGLVVLGIGGRLIMRIIAHWEGRVPVLTPSGTFTIVMMGTIAGTAAGIIHGILQRSITRAPVRMAAFLVFCILFTLYGVKELLPRPKLLFVAIMLVYVILVEIITRQRARRQLLPPAESQSPRSAPSPRAVD
jgi:hypothetical protein